MKKTTINCSYVKTAEVDLGSNSPIKEIKTVTTKIGLLVKEIVLDEKNPLSHEFACALRASMELVIPYIKGSIIFKDCKVIINDNTLSVYKKGVVVSDNELENLSKAFAKLW